MMRTISVEIKSIKKNYPLVESLLYKANEEFAMPENEFCNVMIAASEIIMNAMVHGNMESGEKKIRVTVEYDKDVMKIRILDEGNWFMPNDDLNRKLPEDMMKESGRGIFIVKSLVDGVEYRDTGEGTEFTLIVKKKK